MNERIQELVYELNNQVGIQWNNEDKLKFAELIVRECGQVLVDNTPIVNLVEDWDKGYDRAMNDCIHHIYEHFGVKE